MEVAAALVFHQGRVLITRRAQGTHLAGFWEFPGGKREPGESFEACLRRELKEELDIEVEVGPLWALVRHDYPEIGVEIRFFLSRWTGGQPRPLGCSRFKWVARQNLRRHKFPPADAQLLQQLVRARSLWEGPFCPEPLPSVPLPKSGGRSDSDRSVQPP
ncbi:MAG: (deoxy)nucleoside triphosphate pyrophosphohydrolase [Limisphaera sp.]|nr:(deoxy)nucleoside triphosphate pyrophosphohydrolase [Limisphaera sp.]